MLLAYHNPVPISLASLEFSDKAKGWPNLRPVGFHAESTVDYVLCAEWEVYYEGICDTFMARFARYHVLNSPVAKVM